MGVPFIFFSTPVAMEGRGRKEKREHPTWMSVFPNVTFTTLGSGNKRTVGVAGGLRGLPVHGPLHGFLPASKPELTLCVGGGKGGHTRLVRHGATIQLICKKVAVPLTLRIDLGLICRGCDVRNAIGAQVPHVHPLGGPRCHGCAQSCGLGHGGFHCTRNKETSRMRY